MNSNKLKFQLSLLPDVLKTSNAEHKIEMKKVTMVKLFLRCLMYANSQNNVNQSS